MKNFLQKEKVNSSKKKITLKKSENLKKRWKISKKKWKNINKKMETCDIFYIYIFYCLYYEKIQPFFD